jgi:peptide/nickel transport system permease protein
MVGLYMVLVIVAIAILTPFIAPFDPDALEVGPKLAPPTLEHWMGTDEFRRDMFSRVLYGARVSLSIGFVAVILAATIGTVFGSVAGYFGGWIDRIMMWCTDLILSLPRLILLLAIVGFFRARVRRASSSSSRCSGSPGGWGVARIVRSQVLSLKEQDFIQATKALGLPTSRVLFVPPHPERARARDRVRVAGDRGHDPHGSRAELPRLGVPPPTSTWGAS